MKLKHVFDFSRENGGDYYKSIFEQRSEFSELRAGSFYNLSPEEIEDVLYNVDWEETKDVFVGEGKKVYKTSVSGFFGMIDIDHLENERELVMIDPKGTGYAWATLYNHNFDYEKVDETYAITSVNADGTEFLITVFPGYDINPEEVSTDKFEVGSVVTANDAYNVGIRYVKLG